jgi:hypothetical protein
MITVTPKLAPLLRDLKRIPGQFNRVAKELVDSEARGFVRDAVQSTPPFYSRAAPTLDNPGKWETVTGTEAKKAGEVAIKTDLTGGRRGAGTVRGGIITTMDDALFESALNYKKTQNVRLFIRKDGTVYGTDRSLFKPDATTATLHDHHKALYKNGRMTSAGGRDRSIGRWKFVDKMVVKKKTLETYLKETYKKVGILCSGWAAAADKLNVRLPLWIKRHGTSNGSAVITVGDMSYHLRLENAVSYGTGQRLQAIADRVARGRQRKLASRLPYVVRGAIKRANREALKAT